MRKAPRAYTDRKDSILDVVTSPYAFCDTIVIIQGRSTDIILVRITGQKNPSCVKINPSTVSRESG